MEEENSTQQAYGDLITAVLFVFIITLIAYIINFTANQINQVSVGQQISDVVARQSFLVESISQRLNARGISHQKDVPNGIIRLDANTLSFDSGSYTLSESQQALLTTVAKVLSEVVVCYADQSQEQLSILMNCGPEQKGQLKAVFVEGHTDNTPLSADNPLSSNLELSVLRALTVRDNLNNFPLLNHLKNMEGDPLFFVAGFGEGNPIRRYSAPTADFQNRRIDIRLVLEQPWSHVGR